MKVVLVSFGPEAVACVCDLFREKGSWKMLNWISSKMVYVLLWCCTHSKGI